MALRFLRSALIAFATLLLLVTPSAIYSCGPFLETAVFAFEDRPDGPPQDFAAGKLGIVRPAFRQDYLVVAYRNFSGLSLTEPQQKSAIEVWNRDVVPEHPPEDEAIAAWSKARGQVPGLPPASAISAYAALSEDQPYTQYLNCPGDAFQTAAITLVERAAKVGLQNANLREWASAQDQVFSNCAGGAHVIPAALDSSNALSRADRNYQIAAAHFYGRDFDQAVQQFDAIAQDQSSPWHGVAAYLAARALIRKANLIHKENDQFDPAAMFEAQNRLEAMLAEPRTDSVHQSAVNLLNYVRFRTEPEKRIIELDREIMEANPGTNFKQHLWDYVLLLSHGKQGDDPSDWLQTFHSIRGNYPDALGDQSAQHSLARWQETKSLPWLVAALAAGDSHLPNLDSLLSAARGVPVTSPAYFTVRYYALRLMVASGQMDSARKEMDTLLKSTTPGTPLGSHNLLNEERLRVTTNLEDFLQHAPETPVPSEVDFNTGEDVPASPDTSHTNEPLFNRYAADTLIKRLPLAVLVQAVEGPTLPKNLRREIARSAWVRAVLLDDSDSTTKLQAVLQDVDPPLWKAMEPFRSGTGAAEKHFVALFIILSNPGMKPSVQQGLLRSTTLGELDNYRDNWWCTDMGAGSNWAQSYSIYDKDINLKFVDRDPDFPFPAWLTAEQKSEAIAEWRKLSATGTAPNYLTSQVLSYAKEHTQDSRAPQALHLAVRSTRFGCSNVETSKLSKAAYDFLHEHYPQSEWAAKTKYYY
jgi:hypothetical protein